MRPSQPNLFAEDRRSFWGWAVAAPVIAIFAVFAWTELPHAWGAAHGGGVRGTLLVTGETCGRSCTVYGDFTSHDRRVVERRVDFPGGEDHDKGDVAEVSYAGGKAYEPDSRQWMWVLFFAAGASIGAAVAAWQALLGLREKRLERRHERSVGLDPGNRTQVRVPEPSHVRVVDQANVAGDDAPGPDA